MDVATIIGVFTAFGLVIGAIAAGGNLGAFVDPSSLLIVVGGTIGAVLINYPLKSVLGSLRVARHAFKVGLKTPEETIAKIVDYAGKARSGGLLEIEEELKNNDDPFLVRGLQLVLDGQPPEAIKEIMETEIGYLEERHRVGAEIFSTFAMYSPALGLVGTLIGLVQMLQAMDDPSTIGPAMAVALLTTFYGAVLANMLFNPIAGKLRTRNSEEVMVRELTMTGVLAIAAGNNPRIVEQQLHAYMSPGSRKSAFDG